MKVLVRSLEDPASVNIASHLESMVPLVEDGEFEGHPVLSFGEWRLVTSESAHITNEHLDDGIAEVLGADPELLLFLSRHKSESGARSLTVHPPGNHGNADFGGASRTLVPSAPHAMTTALRRLKEAAAGLEYDVTFEVTHHGPALSTPSFFIEIGSDEDAWTDPAAGEAVATAVKGVMDSIDIAPVVLVGIGGGHYAPRFTDIALGGKASIGHMIPSYHMAEFGRVMLERAIAKSGADGVYVHRKGLKGPQKQTVRELLAEMGVRQYREADLEQDE